MCGKAPEALIVGLDAALVSSLIGDIYDAALQPGLWPAALTRLKAALDFEHATLTLQAMPSGRVMLNVNSGIASPWLERIPAYGEAIVELWGGPHAIASASMDEPAILSRMNAEVADGSSRNRYYLEWRKPQGLIDTIAIGLLKDRETLAAASFVRHERQGPIGRRDIDGVELFAPHLRRAVTISRLLETRAIRAATFEAVLDGIRTPVFLVGPDLELLHANRAGIDLTRARGATLGVQQGRLSVSLAPVQQALQAAVRRSAESEASLGGGGYGLPLAAEDGVPRALHVLPMAARSGRGDVAVGAAAAVFVSSGRAAADIREVAATLYGLSRSEAAVLERITLGETVGQAAAALGIGAATVRTHLLRIYEKTGVHRQAELVRLATALGSPFA